MNEVENISFKDRCFVVFAIAVFALALTANPFFLMQFAINSANDG